jgi:Outer membrane protein beta-barrel domain
MKAIFFKFSAILFVGLFLGMKVHGQQAKGKFFVQLSTGAAIPIGEFGKKDFSFHPDSSYGLAKTGLMVGLKAGYHLNDQWSLSLLVSGLFNKEDEKAFESANGFNGPNAWSSVTVHTWKTFSFLAGPDYNLSLGKKGHGVIFIPSLHIGLLKTAFPGDSAVYHSDRANPGTEQVMAMWRDKAPLKWGFCYQAGIAIQYPFSGRWYLNGGVDLFNSGKLRSSKYDSDQRRFKVSTINVQAGVGVSF